jgi:Tfp pilus assembly protein FimT
VTELLVVIVVIAVIAGFALMQRGSANEQLTRQNAAQQLKTAFERARFDSVKRRAVAAAEMAKVTVTPTSFTLTTFNDDVNGLPVAADVATTLPAGVVIGLYDGTTLTQQEVTFDMRGETPSAPLPQFRVCNVSCTSPTNANSNIVIVTLTGTVNLLPGGSSLPVFGVPTVTNVSTNANINPDTVE